MADIERLSRALKAAHAAGDTAAATKLAQAIKAANQSTQPSQPNYNPPGTGVGRALKRGLYRTGQAGNLLSANINSNMLANMDVNKVETLDRALQLSMPPETYDRVRKYAWDYLGGVETDEDLNSWLDGLEELGVMSQHIAKVKAMTSAAEAAKTDYRQEGGKFDQIEQRGNRALEKAGEKQTIIDNLPMSPTAQTGAQDFQDAEGVLDWAKSSFKNPLGALAFIGEIAAESTPSIAAGIGTSILTGNPVAGAGVMILSGAPQSYSGEFVEFLREKNIDLTDPEAIKNALQNDDILAEASRRSITKASIIMFFEALGMKAGGGILRQTAAQSASGAGGEGASSYVLDGEIVPKDMALEAVAETATVPGEVAIMKGRSMFTSDGKLVDPNSLDADQKQAAASVAKMLRQTANENGLNLKNVNASSSKGAKQALEEAHETISGQLKEITANKAVKGFLTPKNAKTLDELIDDYSAAAVALRQGKNKVKSKVMQKNFDAIMRLLPDSAEKTQIANLLKMSNQVTDLFNNGLKGGLSQYTDYFFPLAPSGAAYDPNRSASAAIGTVSAISTFGKTLAIPAAGRVVDFFTGRRSSVARFVKKNENRLGLAKPDRPSLIEQAEQKKATSKARRQAVAKIATILNAPKPGFVENILLGTGLDRNGLETVLNNMAADFADDPEFTGILNDIQSNLDAEGVEYLDVLSEIIPVIGAYAQANSPDLVTNTPDNPLLKREFEGPNVDPTNPTQPQGGDEFGPQFTTPQNYNRGIENNLQFNRELQDGATLDKSLSLVDRGRIITSLENLTNNLGSSPVPTVQTEIQKLQDAGVSQEAIDTYVKPYADRVIGQQKRNAPKLDEQKSIPDLPPIQGPVLNQTPNPLNIDTNDLAATNLNEMPSAEDIAQMREGDYKPESKRTLVEAVDYLNNKWQQATGRTEPFEYTPENVDRIASLMATEAMQALKNDGNAIGWYDRKLKAAKSVVALVEPRVTQSPDAEAAFDFALAVTSNGQAVADNFKYALEVFRHFMDNGVMPTDTWIKGGERNKAMIEAFDFFNTYNASGQNMAVQDFLDSDFTVKELDEYIANFNSQYGTKLKVPSSEGKGTDVKGSYIIGPKIGQGFYQNIRGNYDPLTMDIWWMRMWNRLVGRPFTTQTEKAANTGRQRVREGLKTKNQGALEKRLTNESLKKLGLTRASLKDQDTFDEFVIELEANYQRFFSKRGKELKGTKQKVEKPELFLATGSLVKNITPQLQAQPKGPGERSYMRTVTKAAIEKLRQNGYMIDTADFQALMWYPEKQLFRKLGVAPGRGADNDYLDAAKMLALKEGFTDDQINQTLPPSDGDGAVSVQPGAEGQTSGVSPGTSRISQAEESRQIPALQSGDVRRQSPRASSTSPVFPKPSLKAVKDAIVRLRPAFQIGKKGSKYENGIQSIDEALELAKALGVTVEMFGTAKEMQAATVLGQLPITNEGTVGAYYGGTIFNRQTFQTRTVERTSTAGTVFALAPGAESSTGTRTDLDVLTTILHELAHALTLSKIDPNVSLFDGARDEEYSNQLMGDTDFSPPGSFVNSAIKPLVMAANGGKPNNAVLQEIDNLQENIEVYTTNNPQERTALRDLKRARKKLEEAKSMGMSQGSIDVYGENIDNYKSYTQNSRELAVDPVLLYLLNPKLAKKLAPKTTALIRGEFEKAKDSKVQFFSHPFAVVAAVVMAMMAAKDEEDEERRMMPPPGALNQPMQPGALSA